MMIKRYLINLGKLIVCVVAYTVGIMLGGMVTTALGLLPPPLPEGLDASAAMVAMVAESPLWALALIGLARSIAGRFWARTLMLTSLSWIANSLNNQIEAAYFGMMASGFWFTIVTYLLPSLLVAATVAWLFPPAATQQTFAAAARSFFDRFSTTSWIVRLSVGAILFMPIYYGFGLLVIPFTIDYYRQGLYGLQIPPLEQLLVILCIRSILFFLACLPILVAWQRSRLSLAICLGLALFFFVGFQPLMIANWMPWSLRLPHILEILADEVVYAWALVLVLGVPATKQSSLPAGPAPGVAPIHA